MFSFTALTKLLWGHLLRYPTLPVCECPCLFHRSCSDRISISKHSVDVLPLWVILGTLSTLTECRWPIGLLSCQHCNSIFVLFRLLIVMHWGCVWCTWCHFVCCGLTKYRTHTLASCYKHCENTTISTACVLNPRFCCCSCRRRRKWIRSSTRK